MTVQPTLPTSGHPHERTRLGKFAAPEGGGEGRKSGKLEFLDPCSPHAESFFLSGANFRTFHRLSE